MWVRLQNSTCVITVGNARNRNADSWSGTQVMPSSASRSPSGQWQLPLDRGLRRHKWEQPASRQALGDLGWSTSCIICKRGAGCHYAWLNPYKEHMKKSCFLIMRRRSLQLVLGKLIHVAFSGRSRGIFWRVHRRPWVHKAVGNAWWGPPCSCLSSSSCAVLFSSSSQTRRPHPQTRRPKRGSWFVLAATSKTGMMWFLGEFYTGL